MVGRKTNQKVLISKLWEVGATIVKTTEFVQGQTCRWGLAWSFLPASKKIVPSHVAEKNNMSFMLEGLQHHQSAFHVLQPVESYFCSIDASSKLDSASFKVDVTLSADQCNSILKTQTQNGNEQYILISANCPSDQLNDMCRFFCLPADTRDTSGERIIAPERDTCTRGIFCYIPAITGSSEKQIQ